MRFTYEQKGTCNPPTYITTSWDDDRVVPSHEFKFASKIQQNADVRAFEAWNLRIKNAPETGNK